jgi:hypothetical protein
MKTIRALITNARVHKARMVAFVCLVSCFVALGEFRSSIPSLLKRNPLDPRGDKNLALVEARQLWDAQNITHYRITIEY